MAEATPNNYKEISVPVWLNLHNEMQDLRNSVQSDEELRDHVVFSSSPDDTGYASLEELLDDVVFGSSPDGTGYVSLIVYSKTSFHHLTHDGRMFDIRIKAYALFHYDGQTKRRIPLQLPATTSRWNSIHPLPHDELLLVDGHCEYRGPGDYDLNATVISTTNGLPLRSFVFGNGLRDVQTTADGKIWTGYSDEGIFGNYGWGCYNAPDNRPIGAHGLVLWDRWGKKLYEYSPTKPELGCRYCWALNATSNSDVWCYFWTSLDTTPLFHIHDQQIVGLWEIPITGGASLAVWGNFVLINELRPRLHLFSLYELLPTQVVREMAIFKLVDDQGHDFTTVRRLMSRGPYLFLSRENKFYRVDIRDLIATL